MVKTVYILPLLRVNMSSAVTSCVYIGLM